MGYGMDLMYQGPKRITEINKRNAEAVEELDTIIASVPEDLRGATTYHLRSAYRSYPQYSFKFPIPTPDTNAYEEIDKLPGVRAMGGARVWMLKNTKFRPIKETDVMLIDALPAVLQSQNGSFIDTVQPRQTLAYIKNEGKIESKTLGVLLYYLPIRIKPPLRKMDEELAKVIIDEIVREKITHVHGILISRPVIYQLVAPWNVIAVYGAKSGVPLKDLLDAQNIRLR
jgi:hypothetical protein